MQRALTWIASDAGGLLACTLLTVGRLSPLGVVYQMPTMASLSGLTLFEAQAGKYREQWEQESSTGGLLNHVVPA